MFVQGPFKTGAESPGAEGLAPRACAGTQSHLCALAPAGPGVSFLTFFYSVKLSQALCKCLLPVRSTGHFQILDSWVTTEEDQGVETVF